LVIDIVSGYFINLNQFRLKNIIALEGLVFFAYNGYDEEKAMGNRYSVDIRVFTDFKEAAETDNLNCTIDYEGIYKLVKEEMKSKSLLLEHIANRIIKSVKGSYSQLERIEVSVSKFNPPIGGICDVAKITLIDDLQ
jgi:dihydroneopterin aldolase